MLSEMGYKGVGKRAFPPRVLAAALANCVMRSHMSKLDLRDESLQWPQRDIQVEQPPNQ